MQKERPALTRAGHILALRQIAQRERADVSSALDLVLNAGIRVYYAKHRLGCGYPGCTRANCCGGARAGHPKQARQIRIVAREEGQ